MWTCNKCGVQREARGGHPVDCDDPYRYVPPFNAKVQRGEESKCWPFMGARVPAGGYGRALLNGKLVAAHRIAYILAYGNIPEGLDVMHLCDNPPCCNPKHLRAATTAENMADMRRKGRGTGTLTAEQVREIRAQLGKVRQSVLAAKYGVSNGIISKLKLGKTYQEFA